MTIIINFKFLSYITTVLIPRTWTQNIFKKIYIQGQNIQ